MKTLEQVNEARGKIADHFVTPGLTESQKCILVGMINALVWVAEGADTSTMDRLLAGEPMAAGKPTNAAARASFDRIAQIKQSQGN